MLRPRCRTLRALSCSDPNWPTQRLTLQIGRAQWRGGEFAADDEGRLQDVDDTLHFERLHEFGADLGVVEQLLADALDGLAHRLDVGGGLEDGGTLENAQAIAAHESPRTTKLT